MLSLSSDVQLSMPPLPVEKAGTGATTTVTGAVPGNNIRVEIEDTAREPGRTGTRP